MPAAISKACLRVSSFTWTPQRGFAEERDSSITDASFGRAVLLGIAVREYNARPGGSRGTPGLFRVKICIFPISDSVARGERRIDEKLRLDCGDVRGRDVRLAQLRLEPPAV